MYLAGIDIYDIMKVTGHSSPKMLKKYIKADSLEVVEKHGEARQWTPEDTGRNSYASELQRIGAPVF